MVKIKVKFNKDAYWPSELKKHIDFNKEYNWEMESVSDWKKKNK